MQNDPPENVYSIEFPPTKAQANNKGEVLWYAKGFGWYKGWFHMAHMNDTSHWTYMPDDLGIEPEPVGAVNLAFEAWLKDYPDDCFGPESLALIKLGFVAAWRRGQP